MNDFDTFRREAVAAVRVALQWFFLAVPMGLLCGFLGTLFHLAVEHATELRAAQPWLLFLLPVAGLLITALYKVTKCEGVGTNNVIRAVQSGEPVSILLVPAIFLGTVLTHLCGGSAGREGAALQMGGSIGWNLGTLLRLKDHDRRTATISGMAAFFSALFGTPLAAACFAMMVEDVGLTFTSAFVPAFTSALIAYGCSLVFGIAPTHFALTAPELNVRTALLHTHIGVFGTLILLVGCWILTGVFINRNFINKVNRAGNVMVDKSGRIVEIVKHKVVPGHLHAEEADGAVSAAATPAAPDAAEAAGTERAAEPEMPRAVRVPEPETPRAARTPDPEIVRPAREPEAAATQIVRGEEDDPFVETSSDGTPVGSEPAREAESAVRTDEDGEFIEVDLSRPEGRLVLGPGGLVELERPSTPSAAPSAGTPVRNMPVSDGPFTELTVGGDAGASSPAALAGAAPESLSGTASLAAAVSASGDAPAHGAGSAPEYESAPADASVSAGSASCRPYRRISRQWRGPRPASLRSPTWTLPDGPVS